MPGGRPRKPTHLKVVAGTSRKHRENPAEPVPSEALPTAPDWLSTRAAEIFDDTVGILGGMALASASDTAMLAMLASRLEEVEIATAVIEDLGRTYTTTTQAGDTMHRSRPEVAQRSEAMRHAQSLLAEFGLSPAARSKVTAGKPNAQNPFAALG